MSTLVEWVLLFAIGVIAWLAVSIMVGFVGQTLAYPVMHKSMYPTEKMRMYWANVLVMAITLSVWYAISMIVKVTLPGLYSSITGMVIFLSVVGAILMQNSLLSTLRHDVARNRYKGLDDTIDEVGAMLAKEDAAEPMPFGGPLVACRILVMIAYGIVAAVFMLPGLY